MLQTRLHVLKRHGYSWVRSFALDTSQSQAWGGVMNATLLLSALEEALLFLFNI